ncbi:MAG: hypothetical protein OEY94_08255 [Alphaproteobacteria bacterium]|nr:hypothetical protein [Alphaproteobacteria bacterium]
MQDDLPRDPKDAGHFNETASLGKEAYSVLDRVFTHNQQSESFMDLEKRYQTLLVRTWLPSTVSYEATSMVEEMDKIRRKQIAITREHAVDPVTCVANHDVSVLLDRAEKEGLNEWERGNLRVMKNHYLYLSAFKKDPSLIDRYLNTLKDGSNTWLESLDIEDAEQSWEMQRPAFEAAFGVLKESMKEPARLLSLSEGRHVALSEAALRQLNPGVTNEDVDKIFAEMKPGFKNIVSKIQHQINSGTAPQILDLPEIPSEVQRRIFERVKDDILQGAGYDQKALDRAGVSLQFETSATGTCWGHSKDIVLAVETYPKDITKGLGNTWHETGHLLYLLEMNKLPQEIRNKPVATFNGFGVHEAAAIMMEQTGLREKAYEVVEPIMREELAKAKQEGLLPSEFDVNDPALSAENMHRQANRPNLSDMEWCTSELALTPNMAWRVNAFRKIFDDQLELKDLPQFWAKEMMEWTGIEHDPKNFRVGEDHIFSGLGGYFWAYMTGVFTATTLQTEIAAKGSAPDNQVNNLASYSAPYSQILRDRIFQHASKETPDKLLENALGTNISDSGVIKGYLRRLSAAAKSGMPPPDTDLAAKFGGRENHLQFDQHENNY